MNLIKNHKIKWVLLNSSCLQSLWDWGLLCPLPLFEKKKLASGKKVLKVIAAPTGDLLLGIVRNTEEETTSSPCTSLLHLCPRLPRHQAHEVHILETAVTQAKCDKVCTNKREPTRWRAGKTVERMWPFSAGLWIMSSISLDIKFRKSIPDWLRKGVNGDGTKKRCGF